jgi:hypothetical protein
MTAQEAGAHAGRWHTPHRVSICQWFLNHHLRAAVKVKYTQGMLQEVKPRKAMLTREPTPHTEVLQSRWVVPCCAARHHEALCHEYSRYRRQCEVLQAVKNYYAGSSRHVAGTRFSWAVGACYVGNVRCGDAYQFLPVSGHSVVCL